MSPSGITSSRSPYACWYGESLWTRGTPVVQMFKIPDGDMTHVNATWQTNDKWMDCSLTLATNPLTSSPPSAETLNEWRTRKIIQSIHIKRNSNELNAFYQYANKLINDNKTGTVSKHTYSIVQVKKSLIEKQLDPATYPGSEISNKSFWSKHQLISGADIIANHFRNDEIKLTDLHYNLPADEDLVLINHVTLQNHIVTGDELFSWHVFGKGVAQKNHESFEIIIHYINDFF